MADIQKSKSEQFWEPIDAFGRRLQTIGGYAMLGVLGLMILLAADSMIHSTVRYVRGVGLRAILIEVSVALAGLGFLYLIRRPLGRSIKWLAVAVAKCLYYAFAAGFYVSIGITVLSLLSYVGDGLNSFLTAPIGIKPDAQIGEFGGLFYYFLAATAALGIGYAIARGLRTYLSDLGAEVKTLMAEKPTAE